MLPDTALIRPRSTLACRGVYHSPLTTRVRRAGAAAAAAGSALCWQFPMQFFSKTLDKLKGALRKTAMVLNTDVRTLFIPGRQINDEFLNELEEKFLQADIGVGN